VAGKAHGVSLVGERKQTWPAGAWSPQCWNPYGYFCNFFAALVLPCG
jgi:hypothetical protein